VDNVAGTVQSQYDEGAMSFDQNARPLIWVLKGWRKGDNDQAMALALEIGGRVESKQLQFNGFEALPNWLLRAGVRHLTKDAQSVLRPPWPDLVVATGRRTALVAVWIKQQSGGQTKLVHIGRPRLDLRHFDLVVTTPQYGLPEDDNVVELTLPFARPKSVDAAQLQEFSNIWAELPRPWILGVIGGGKYPLRLQKNDLSHYGQALSDKAANLGGSVILLHSPRSPKGALQQVEKMITAPCWSVATNPQTNPYQAALKLCDHMVVTSDSVSMISEMVLTTKPVWIYRLKRSAFAVSWNARHGLAAALARRGLLNPPRDVEKFVRMLMEKNLVADVLSATPAKFDDNVSSGHKRVVQRIKSLLAVLPQS
jgi:uncharacterized protein